MREYVPVTSEMKLIQITKTCQGRPLTVTHSPNKYSHLTQHLTNSIVNEKLSVLSGKAHIT